MNRTILILSAALLGAVTASRAATTNYFTAFETPVYSLSSPLVGTTNWVGRLFASGTTNSAGSAGNGITNTAGISVFATPAAAMSGQQGYLGRTSITTYTNLEVWQPLTNAISATATNVTFSVALQILPSANGPSDRFGWKFYNAQSNLLFAVKYDDFSSGCTYWLSASNAWYTPGGTGANFADWTVMTNVFTLNPASNSWSATRSDVTGTWITSHLISSNTANLSIAYVAAFWEVRTAGSPGDNFMLFDNYLLTSAIGAASPPAKPTMAVRSYSPATGTALRLTGQNTYKFAIDTITNVAATNWLALTTNTVTTNSFDYTDPGATNQSKRFYRGRWVP